MTRRLTDFERKIADLFGPGAIEADYAVVDEAPPRRARVAPVPPRRTWTAWRVFWLAVLFLWFVFCGAVAGWLGPSLTR